MSKLTTEEKLAIANSGQQFQEEGASSWVGIKVRKGEKQGVIAYDTNGMWRILTVRFEDGTEETIRMNNIGQDPEYIHQYEWHYKETWYRF